MFCAVRLDCRAEEEISLTNMCELLKVRVSGYRAWKRGGVPDHVPAFVTPMAGTALCVLSEAREALTKRFHAPAIDAEIASPDAR